MATPQKEVLPNQDAASGCLVRLVWMLLGNLVLVISALSISHRAASFSGADVVFWVTVVAVIWLRYIDITRLHGQTATGTPATMAHWRRYSMLMAAGAFALWIIAHAYAWKVSATIGNA